MSKSTAKLKFSISTDLHTLLQRAAELQGKSITDFIVLAVQDAAARVIDQAEIIRLSIADQKIFTEAMMSPHKKNPALKRAFARRKKLIPNTISNP